MNKPAEKVVTLHKPGDKSANSIVLNNAANELVFAVVGHVGSGTSAVAEQLVSLLKDTSAIGDAYDVSLVKATELISDWASRNGQATPKLGADNKKTIAFVTDYQDLGDAMRKDDLAAVAKAFAIKIRALRAKKLELGLVQGKAIEPDGARRAYVLDSIRHPAEVELLRHIYQDAFVLVGVVCESDTREERVAHKYPDATGQKVREFMRRDEKAVERHGQKVSDAFHLADFFIDNTPSRMRKDNSPNPAWDVAEKLSRLVKIIRQQDIVRPESGETAMWYAHGAAMRSACMSRQVGAALIDRYGNVIATGTNEVPRAGGGVYGEGFHQSDGNDHRCAYRSIDGKAPYCSNTREQTTIVDALLDSISETRTLSPEERRQFAQLFRSGRIGELLEFSRAVHAEMDAILTAGRKAISTVGTRLFVTTFPCHYCARHIVSAGIDEVQYIEPYPKSHALRLHSDAVQITAENWALPSAERISNLVPTDGGRMVAPESPKVLFRPFTGVAPRLYKRAFLKEGALKNKSGDREVSTPEWGAPWHLRRLSHAQLEAELARGEEA